MRKPFTGQVAIVTGAGRGIGKTIAETLSRNGMRVAGIVREIAALEKIKKQKKNRHILWVAADVRNETEVKDAVHKTVKRYKKIDHIVNCAGVFAVKPVEDTTLDEFNEIIGTNLTGTFLFTREVLKVMKKQKSGRIYNFSSVGGRIGLGNKAAYSASKHGVVGFSKALAKEVRCFGIKVHIIYPYLVDSMLERDWSGKKEHLDILHPSDAAKVIVFLANLPKRVDIQEIILDPFEMKN